MPLSSSHARPRVPGHAFQRLWAVSKGSKRGPWKWSKDTEPMLCRKTEAVMSPLPGEDRAAGDIITASKSMKAPSSWVPHREGKGKWA